MKRTEVVEQPAYIAADGVRNLQELDRIDPALTTLELRDVGLLASDPLRQALLRLASGAAAIA